MGIQAVNHAQPLWEESSESSPQDFRERNAKIWVPFADTGPGWID